MTQKDKNNNKKDGIVRERTTHIKDKGKSPSAIETKQKKKLDIIDEDKEKGMLKKRIVKEMIERMERQGNSILKLTNSKETLRKKLDMEKDIEKERDMIRKEKENDSLVNKGWKNDRNYSFQEKIDERIKSIERSMIYTQNDSLAKLTKKIETLNSPLDIERRRDITVLITIETLDNEQNDRHSRNTICHKCKQYGHTKKQCDRHNKIVKQISKLDFEKDVINELIGMFNVKQKEIDQATKKRRTKIN